MQQERFSTLYRKYAGLVYAVARTELRDLHDAEDVTADVFLQLWESDPVFRDDDAVRSWLVICTRNRCRNLKKSWVSRLRVNMEVTDAAHTDAGGTDPRASEALERLRRLPEKYRLPLMLYAVEGYSVREIAEMLSMKESTVSTRIERAREKMRKDMEVQ